MQFRSKFCISQKIEGVVVGRENQKGRGEERREGEEKGREGKGRGDHFLFFSESEVVFGKRNTEDDGCDTFEAVNPLLAFAPLATHVHQAEVEPFVGERGFDYTCCLHPRSQHVLHGRHISCILQISVSAPARHMMIRTLVMCNFGNILMGREEFGKK